MSPLPRNPLAGAFGLFADVVNEALRSTRIATLRTIARIDDVFQRRKPRSVNADQSCAEFFGRALGEQHRAIAKSSSVGGSVRIGISQQALLIELADFLRRGRSAPNGANAGVRSTVARHAGGARREPAAR